MGVRKSARKAVPETASEQCAARIMETVPLVMRFIRAEMRARKATELSVPQFRTLTFLDRSPGASLSDLAEFLGVTLATASANTERLVQRDFVHRCDHPQERRKVVLKLTSAGKKHLEESRQKTRAFIADLLSGLSDEQIDRLDEGLILMKQVFEQASETPPDAGP